MKFDKFLESNKPLLISEVMPFLKKIYKNRVVFICSLIIAVITFTGTIAYIVMQKNKTSDKILIARESTLNEAITKAENRNDILEAEVLLLKNEVKSLSKQKDQKKLLKISKYLADTEITGSGIEISMTDNNSDFAPVQEESTIIHNTDLLKIVNFLWEQGATGISINNERIVQNSAISCVGATILVNKKRINAPFTIFAIGENLSKELVENSIIMLSLKLRGIEFSISEKQKITLPASKYSMFKE